MLLFSEESGADQELTQSTTETEEAAASVGGGDDGTMDLAEEYNQRVTELRKDLQERPEEFKDLQDKPLQTLGVSRANKERKNQSMHAFVRSFVDPCIMRACVHQIVVGALLLFLGLGRLPALFWLIGTASLAEDSFRTELWEVLLLKKPFGEASPQLTQQVLVVLALVAVAIFGELSVNVIEPLKVNTIPGSAPS